MDQTPDSKPPDATDQAAACTAEPAPRPRKRRLRWLVLAHVAIGLSMGPVAAWFFHPPGPDVAVAAFVGIVFCQTCLLGIWSGLGTSSWWVRLLGLIAGMGYLVTLFDLCLGRPYRDNHLILSLAAVLVAGGLLIGRCFRGRICVPSVGKAGARRIQFSIRQMLILTFAVACLVTLGKWLGPGLIPGMESFLAVLIGLVLGVPGLISVWPVLGTRHPILSSIIVTAIAAGLGFCLARLFPPLGGVLVVFWITITVEALSLVASLLVVRACGYRLVWLPVGRNPSARIADVPTGSRSGSRTPACP